MKSKEGMKEDISHLSVLLASNYRNEPIADLSVGYTGKTRIHRMLHDLRSALFPGVYDSRPADGAELKDEIERKLHAALHELNALVAQVLDKSHCEESEWDNRPEQFIYRFMSKIPDIVASVLTDIEAAYYGDPAAMSIEEVVLSYPSIEAVSIHRISHELYKMNLPIIPRIMSEYAHSRTGIDIHPGATIGSHFFVDHGSGVVIGETCRIGNHVRIYQGVTLGARNFTYDELGNPVKGIKRHPNIEDRVVIYSGATILGGDTIIGHDSQIGGNVWLTESVPPYSKVCHDSKVPKITSSKVRVYT